MAERTDYSGYYTGVSPAHLEDSGVRQFMILFQSSVSIPLISFGPLFTVSHLSPQAHHMRHDSQLCFSSIIKTTATQNSTIRNSRGMTTVL